MFGSTNVLTSIAGDMWTLHVYILTFGFGGAVFFSFAYAYAMRIPIITKTVVWGSIWGVFLFVLALAGYLHYMVGVYRVSCR